MNIVSVSLCVSYSVVICYHFWVDIARRHRSYPLKSDPVPPLHRVPDLHPNSSPPTSWHRIERRNRIEQYAVVAIDHCWRLAPHPSQQRHYWRRPCSPPCPNT